MEQRRIEYMPLDDVKPAARNPKRHDTAGINRSIARFGLAEVPTLDERTGRLVAGHGRVDQVIAIREAGQEAPGGIKVDKQGRWLVPVLRGWSSRSDQEAEAYLVTSNSMTMLGGWDNAELGALLADLDGFDPALLEVTGHSQGELAALLADTGGLDLGSGAPGGGGGDVGPPDEFPSYDENLPTEHQCPACGYRWSGSSAGKGAGGLADDLEGDPDAMGEE